MRFYIPFIISLSILLCGSFLTVNAQQTVQISHWYFQQSSFNPGVIGMEENIKLNGTARFQWVGLEGAPQSQVLGVAIPLPGIKSAIGISLENDLIGAGRETGVKMQLARRFQMGGSEISVGLDGGIFQKYLDGSILISPDGNYDGETDHQDPLLDENSATAMVPDLGFGIFWQKEQIEIGLSGQQLLPYTVKLNNQKVYDLVPHFNLTGSYLLDVSTSFSLQPFLLIKSDLTKIQMEAGLFVSYDEFIGFGISYKGYNNATSDALSLYSRLNFTDRFEIGYSYDWSVSGLKDHSGSHEINVVYLLNNILAQKGGKKTYNPRFL